MGLTQSRPAITAGTSDFSTPNHQTGPGANSVFYAKCVRVITGRGGRGGPDRVATCSHPSSVEVKTVALHPYSCVCLHDEHRVNLTFTIYIIKNISVLNSKKGNKDVFNVET